MAGGNDPFTQKVVHDLMSKTNLYGKNHHLFTDNFYTKVPLAHHLLQRKTFLTGTIRKTSRFISRQVKQANVAVGRSLYFRKGKVLIVKYKERATRKPVMLISTACHAEDKLTVSRSGNERVKPVMIGTYNQYMGGVDCQDKSIYHVTCARQTKKYWKKIVYNFVDMALLNSYIVYRYHSRRPMSRWDYINKIIRNLVQEDPPAAQTQGDAPQPQDPQNPQLGIGLDHACVPLGGKNNSVVCAPKSHPVGALGVKLVYMRNVMQL